MSDSYLLSDPYRSYTTYRTYHALTSEELFAEQHYVTNTAITP